MINGFHQCALRCIFPAILAVVFCRDTFGQLTWTVQNSGTTASLGPLIHVRDKFIATGSGGIIVVSEDGKTWQTANTGTNFGINSVVFFKNQFIAAANFNTFLFSDDGLEWTTQTLNPNLEDDLVELAVGNDMLLARSTTWAPFGGKLYKSTDGISWTRIPSTSYTSSVAYGKGVFVFVEATYLREPPSMGSISYTSDGDLIGHDADYIIKSPANNLAFKSVTFIDSMFVAVGDSGRFLFSSDGIHWTDKSSRQGPTFYEAIYSQGWFVGIAGSRPMRPLATNRLLISTDAENWIECEVGVESKLYGLSCVGGMFIAVGDSGTILTSNIETSIGFAPQRSAETKGAVVSITQNASGITVRLFSQKTPVGDSRIRVYTAAGKLAYAAPCRPDAERIIIPGRLLPRGMYCLALKSGAETHAARFMVK